MPMDKAKYAKSEKVSSSSNSSTPKNMSGGKDAARANKMKDDATKPKGRANQPRGSADMKAKPKMAKKEKNLTNMSF